LNGRSIKEELNILLQKGFSRILTEEGQNTAIERIEDLLEQEDRTHPLKLKKGQKAFLLIDRIVAKKDFDEDDLHRIADSVQTAFYESEVECFVHLSGEGRAS